MARDYQTPLPYYRWYWQDWRANRRVQRLSWLQRGAYRELLDECWAEGSIPDDVAKLAEIVGCTIGEMTEMWPTIKTFFTPLPRVAHRLTNERLNRERTVSDRLRVTRSVAGKMGGIASTVGAPVHSGEQGELLPDAKQPKAHARQKRIVQKRRVEQSKGKKRIKADGFAEVIATAWNAMAKQVGAAQIIALEGKRKTSFEARLAEPGWVDLATKAIAYLGTDSWYGQNPSAIRFDTLIQPGKAQYYVERSSVPRSASSNGGTNGRVARGLEALKTFVADAEAQEAAHG